MKFKAACIQLSSQDDIDQNFIQASNIIKDAAKDGADFITIPEHCDIMLEVKSDIHKYAQPQDQNPLLDKYKTLAAQLNKWLLIGSIAIKIPNSKKLANRCFLINDQGEVMGFYDKMHLFDADIVEDRSYRESDNFVAGNDIKINTLPWGNLGMSVCYDIRFPNLYNQLALNGASIITIPAAFVKLTGAMHWHTLVRARAIETGCFVIAPDQTGTHPGGSQTYGHSLIVDPWGKILAQANEEVGFISAEIDLEISKAARQQIPNLKHSKEISYKK